MCFFNRLTKLLQPGAEKRAAYFDVRQANTAEKVSGTARY
jgi:hypothetical protein